MKRNAMRLVLILVFTFFLIFFDMEPVRAITEAEEDARSTLMDLRMIMTFVILLAGVVVALYDKIKHKKQKK